MIGELPDGVEPGSSGGNSGSGGSAGVGAAGSGNSAGISGSCGASGAGASGGTGGASGGTGGASGGTGGTGGCPKPCDCDNDGVESDSTACGGKDCDDDDPEVFTGQTKFFTKPSKTQDFDYNCSKMTEHERTAALKCVIAACPSGQGWNGSLPVRGTTAEWGDCSGPLCTFKKLDNVTVACH